jgi:threonyl-tRNA synthetase
VITVELPSGDQLNFEGELTGRTVAERISSGLARQAVAVKVSGVFQELNAPITSDCTIEILKADSEEPEVLELLRHSCAHVMAEAITALFPGTKLAYGPPIKDGFFYDMDIPEVVSEKDFRAIEKKMKEIVKANRPFVRCEFAPEQGLERVAGDKYKTDNAQRALEKGAESLSFYKTGEEETHFEDLCSGPHVPSTGFLKAFKVMSVSGAYWHGDATSDSLTRVYGTCFPDKKALAKYLHMLEEAKKRDHRKIGKEMNLFSLHEDNPGQVFWHPKGWKLNNLVVGHVRSRLEQFGYQEVNTPLMMPQNLWERSGHWAKYKENMFVTTEKENDEDARIYALKPMNCPGHTLIYRSMVQSYRDLPLRMAEFGNVIRNEPSGTLHGIMRARSFTQDDAHIFCTPEQLTDEVINCVQQVKLLYGDFGFDPESVKVKFSTRPETRIGSDEEWDEAEASLERACEAAKLDTVVSPGEGAFYGPKLEFTLVDSLGREWQCGTIQVDYLLASKERLDVDYVDVDGEKRRPIIIHRALLGSFERFIGIMIENVEGKFPLWLAPEQVRVLQVTDAQNEYAKEVNATLLRSGFRSTLDAHQEKLGAKIRRARLDRVSRFLVLGAKEAEDRTATLQLQDGSNVGTFGLDELLERLKSESKGPEENFN